MRASPSAPSSTSVSRRSRAGASHAVTLYRWIPLGVNQAVGQIPGRAREWYVDVAFRLDSLSALMLVFVTFVGFLIHVYSVGYMGHDGGLRALLRLPEPLHVLDARARARRRTSCCSSSAGRAWASARTCSSASTTRRSSRPTPARRRSSSTAIGDFGFVLGIFGGLRPLRLARLRQGLRQAAAETPAPYTPVPDADLPAPASSAPAASRRSSRSTSGCPTPWPARRPSPP